VRALLLAAQPGAVAPVRMALIPGAYHAARDLIAAGFAAAVARRRLAVDLVLVDLEFAHVTDRSVLVALEHTVLDAARAAGCESVWIGGVSLGGWVALACAERRPGSVDGLCLIAPYLGTRTVAAEIARAGGLAAWEPRDLADDDEERRIWRFLKTNRTRPLAMHLGFGRDDRFADSQQLAAGALAADAVDVIDGGHEWPVFGRLWENFLDRRPHSWTESHD
jgi:pimeloyl-ACP methyl ester carboxylesterase